MKIKILVSANNFVYILDVDTETNFFVCNGKTKNLNTFEFKEKLFDIIFCWDKNNVIPDITDAQEYKIFISDKNERKALVGKGKYPHNYNEFISLLKEIENNE